MWEGIGFVIGVGLFTAIVCGLGTLPLFVIDELSDRLTVTLWRFAGGVMLFASLLGFIVEGVPPDHFRKSLAGSERESYSCSSRIESSADTSSIRTRWQRRISTKRR